MARTFGGKGVVPKLRGVQVAPLSVLLKAPLPDPTYMVDGVDGSKVMQVAVANCNGMVVTCAQLFPPSVVLWRLPFINPAYTTDEFVGSTAIEMASGKICCKPLSDVFVHVVPPSELRYGPLAFPA